MSKIGEHIVFLSILFFALNTNAQEFETKINGRVYSKDKDVGATHVSNISENRGTITDANGFFDISVRLNDTLVFSAVQYKKKEIVVTVEILAAKKLEVFLEEALTELNEVVIMPYNLSGELNSDVNTLKTGPIVTASTENLPNAYLKPVTQSQRKLYTARTWDFKFYGLAFTSKLDPIFNYISGRTKMLNERVARDKAIDLVDEVRKYYSDSLYVKDLKIPKKKIDDFVYFCEIDSSFTAIIANNDRLKLWEFMKKRSLIYRKNNQLD